MPPQRLAALWRSAGRLAVPTSTAAPTTAMPALRACVRPFASSAPRLLETVRAPPPAPPQAAAAPPSQPPPPAETLPSSPENAEALRQLARLGQGLPPFDAAVDGHKFGLTRAATRPAFVGVGADSGADVDSADTTVGARKLQDRYDPAIAQLTRLLMRDGKLAKAQRDMAFVLNALRTSPPPMLNPARPLLPGHPPAAALPLDPTAYLTLAVDSVAPLIKIRSFAGIAGGGRMLPVPVPLAARQRRRTAFAWILDIVNKKQSRGSGRGMLAQRIAEEVIAVVEGRSSLWDKRQLLHKQGTSARANLRRVRL